MCIEFIGGEMYRREMASVDFIAHDYDGGKWCVEWTEDGGVMVRKMGTDPSEHTPTTPTVEELTGMSSDELRIASKHWYEFVTWDGRM